MALLSFDIYRALRPFLFCLDAEKAHALAIAFLKKGLLPVACPPQDEVLRTRMAGLNFAHPIGLAAGFDKHAEVIAPLFDMGFSFIEFGGVTPLPQNGNPRPRLFRIQDAEAIINRFGFNSIGADVFLRRLIAYRDTQTQSKLRILGVNLAKNKETVEAADDYTKGVISFARHADFLTVNVSSPNTPGLRDMQGREALTDLLQKTIEMRKTSGAKPLLFLKIAPDISEAQAHDIAEVSLASGIDGIIVGNTTISRPSPLAGPLAEETGGLSGKPLFALSTKVLGLIYQLTKGKMPLIGCGGVFTGADAYAKIRAGASLIQIYSALVYKGPFVAVRIANELAELLKRDGFKSAHEAIGADFLKS